MYFLENTTSPRRIGSLLAPYWPPNIGARERRDSGVYTPHPELPPRAFGYVLPVYGKHQSVPENSFRMSKNPHMGEKQQSNKSMFLIRMCPE